MALDLRKNDRLDLSKPGLKNIQVIVSWGLREGVSADLDASAIFLGSSGKMWAENSLVFYKQCGSPGDPVFHWGDQRTGTEGAEEADGEKIDIDLPRVDPRTSTILVVITSYSDGEPIHFGKVRDALVRVVDRDKNAELCRYDLTEDLSGHTAVAVAALQRKGSSWEFVAMAEALGKSSNGLADVVEKYG